MSATSDSEFAWWPGPSSVGEVNPSEFTGRFWTGGDTLAVLRQLRDGSLYLDTIRTDLPAQGSQASA